MVLLVLACLCVHALASQTIVLLRHGEKKTYDENGGKHIEPVNLSVQGYARAALLPAYYAKMWQPPAQIYAMKQSTKAGKDHSNRPYETVMPLAAAYHMSINTDYSVKQGTELAIHVLESLKDGQTAVICWEHAHLVNVAAALGATWVTGWGANPQAKTANVYDIAWVITVTPASVTLTAIQTYEVSVQPSTPLALVPISKVVYTRTQAHDVDAWDKTC